MDSTPGALEALGEIVAEIVNQFDEARETTALGSKWDRPSGRLVRSDASEFRRFS